jgi:LysM repeat protein
MSSFGRFSLLVIVSVAMATASGCSPGDSGQGDEEKEPHYVLGNSRYNEMDWPGAIDAFQESLEVNPHSAAAHFRLAELFDTKYPDPAAAIYHYQQYLKLEPDAKNSEVINARIHSCKVLLASDECGLPDSPAIQKQMESLVSQNHELQGQVDKLTAEVREWNAYYASLKAAGNAGNNANNNAGAAGQPAAQPGALAAAPDDISSAPSQPDPAAVANAGPQTLSPADAQTQTQGQTRTGIVSRAPDASRKPAAHTSRSHTHVVGSGETLAAIARKHGLSITALEEANPGVNPRKLHVGQLLVLPP